MRHTRIIVTHYGGPEALRVVEEECPAPKHGEVRVRVLAAGVSLPDVMMREGRHPKTPRLPFTPGWDLVGVVDRLGAGVSGLAPGLGVAALPITGAYAEFVCLPPRELVPVPSGVDAAEAVSLVLNYITAYQMLHRSARVSPGQHVLIHGAAGGVGSALVQLGRLAELEMYGTCSSRGASAVTDLGALPIEYQHQDFVQEIHRLTCEGVDVVFDGISGPHIWRSREALRPGGRVVAYGLTSSLRGGRLASGRAGRRHRFRRLAIFGVYIAGGWLLPGRKRVVPYSIQWLKRLDRPGFARICSPCLTSCTSRRLRRSSRSACLWPRHGMRTSCSGRVAWPASSCLCATGPRWHQERRNIGYQDRFPLMAEYHFGAKKGLQRHGNTTL
jgi:NADPH2:quinone reductase